MATGFPVKANYATGDVLTATNMNDLSGTVNYLQYMTPRNYILNSAFNVWQRGTSFSNPANGSYTADRWKMIYDGTGATRTISQQSFTPGTAPVAGYEGIYFFRYAVTAAGTGNNYQGIIQPIENVQTLAGTTATFSFWAKGGSSFNASLELVQNFGSGGSASVYATLSSSSVAVTTSWQRFTVTATIPSISGKTVGTNSYLQLGLYVPANATNTLDIWGVQLEQGSAGNTYMPNQPTYATELAACQRYYENSYDTGTAIGSNTQNGQVTFRGLGYAASSSGGSANVAVWNEFVVPFRIKKRGTPSIQLYSSATGTAGRFRNYDSGADVSGYSLDGIGQMNFSFGGNQFISPNQYCGFQWTADAEL